MSGRELWVAVPRAIVKKGGSVSVAPQTPVRRILALSAIAFAMSGSAAEWT